jgi:hypothetical protein
MEACTASGTRKPQTCFKKGEPFPTKRSTRLLMEVARANGFDKLTTGGEQTRTTRASHSRGSPLTFGKHASDNPIKDSRHAALVCGPLLHCRDLLAGVSAANRGGDKSRIEARSHAELGDCGHPSVSSGWIRSIRRMVTLMNQGPNQAPEPTSMVVTPRAEPRVAPTMLVAHL